MDTTRRNGFGVILGGSGGVVLAVLGALVAVLAGWFSWLALPVAWLGGNAAFVLLLVVLSTRDRERQRTIEARLSS